MIGKLATLIISLGALALLALGIWLLVLWLVRVIDRFRIGRL